VFVSHLIVRRLSREFVKRGKLLLLASSIFAGISQSGPLTAVLRQPASGLPPTFEELRSPGSAQYVWRTSDVAVTLSAGGIVALKGRDGSAVGITFPGATPVSKPSGESALQWKSRFYLGEQTNWREGSHFERVRYSEIYPGIDLVFVTTSGRLEYNFEIGPHADPGAIRIRFEGAAISLDRAGDLEIQAPGFTMVQQRPHATQNEGNRERAVACRYVLAGRQEARLRTGVYDREAALTIDPTLSFSTYLGGSGFDAIYGVATDSSGNLYLAGETSSGSLWSNIPPLGRLATPLSRN
jgi:hypothetical protein